MKNDLNWQQTVLDSLAQKDRSLPSGTTLNAHISNFFIYLRFKGYESREKKDCRSHFYNKPVKDLKSEKKKINSTNMINVGDVAYRLLNCRTMMPRFRLPLTKEETFSLLVSAVQGEVENRYRTFIPNENLTEQLQRLHGLLTRTVSSVCFSAEDAETERLQS